ncbi:MAG TPA: alpha/beta hydrolase, partial [Psychrobacter sp.]|nr:alpha/beta hydrolase [Psychrobacter sp.]
MQEYNRHKRYLAEGTELKLAVASSHLKQNYQQLVKNTQTLSQDLTDIRSALIKAQTPSIFGLWQQWLSYSTDSTKRLLQTAEILKDRGDIFIEHELAGCPPVLDYDYDIILDASTFDRPCNYVLLRIKPPEGVVTEETNRPYIIIDPRAGHGAGIGGFKPESQVGVALNNGRPVYFVAFKRLPEPTQTIADVTYAEARFVREVEKRHPDSQSPVVVGNCQGGWAALILAATHPDIKGPIVMNGAPVAAWSGKIGVDPMRYKAGVNGGTWLAMMSADINNGVFDGAWLVNNFEQMNPYRNYVGKYYDLYKNPAANRERFLDFERWWGGFFTMNEAEIRWIVENIFIGNRIARNTGQLEKGVNIDLRNVKAPIIVFASRGDDITPPPQALAWILDAYTDEKEIEVCGQRIVYMIHEQVGHLGIFVSSKVANHEHKGMA